MRIIEQYKNVALVELNKSFYRFVVAWNYSNGSWQQGHYFETLEEAREKFNEYK